MRGRERHGGRDNRTVVGMSVLDKVCPTLPPNTAKLKVQPHLAHVTWSRPLYPRLYPPHLFCSFLDDDEQCSWIPGPVLLGCRGAGEEVIWELSQPQLA